MSIKTDDGSEVPADDPESNLERPVADDEEESTTVNVPLPSETQLFELVRLKKSHLSLSEDQWFNALRGTEVRDINQRLILRPIFAAGVFLLLVGQNIGIWFVVVWAIQTQQLQDLQLIFSTLIAGTLAQSYFILRLIANKVFSDIDYHSDKVKKD